MEIINSKIPFLARISIDLENMGYICSMHKAPKRKLEVKALDEEYRNDNFIIYKRELSTKRNVFKYYVFIPKLNNYYLLKPLQHHEKTVPVTNNTVSNIAELVKSKQLRWLQ